jgi:nitrile hydratase
VSEAAIADTGVTRRFKAGDRITVRDDYPIGHIRTPVYVRGKGGVITRYLGAFKNPERLAIGKDGLPKKNLYEVRFLQTDIWPDYTGGKNDSVLIDLYEHWLERA